MHVYVYLGSIRPFKYVDRLLVILNNKYKEKFVILQPILIFPYACLFPFLRFS